MSSQVPTPVVPTVGEIAGMSPADLEVLARSLDGERRRVEAALATLVNRVDAAGAFTGDGHRSVKAWGRATCNWSGGEAARFVKTGRMLARFQSAATAATAGGLGVAGIMVGCLPRDGLALGVADLRCLLCDPLAISWGGTPAPAGREVT